MKIKKKKFLKFIKVICEKFDFEHDINRKDRWDIDTPIIKPQCPECKGLQVYYRIKTNTYFCRICGNYWEKK